jgi:hypothetical protein
MKWGQGHDPNSPLLLVRLVLWHRRGVQHRCRRLAWVRRGCGPEMDGEEMRERPILFSGEMVRAILEGRKSQTRRVVKPQPVPIGKTGNFGLDKRFGNPVRCPYGQPGDRLWVRETLFNPCRGNTYLRRLHYVADGQPSPLFRERASASKLPSIYMPREASRITLEITNVRVQRLQDISEEDAKHEGLSGWLATKGHWPPGSPWEDRPWAAEFNCLWDKLNAKRGFGWDANPWVWALTFKGVQP